MATSIPAKTGPKKSSAAKVGAIDWLVLEQAALAFYSVLPELYDAVKKVIDSLKAQSQVKQMKTCPCPTEMCKGIEEAVADEATALAHLICLHSCCEECP